MYATEARDGGHYAIVKIAGRRVLESGPHPDRNAALRHCAQMLREHARQGPPPPLEWVQDPGDLSWHADDGLTIEAHAELDRGPNGAFYSLVVSSGTARFEVECAVDAIDELKIAGEALREALELFDSAFIRRYEQLRKHKEGRP